MSPDPSTKGPQRSVRIGKYRVVTHLATGGMGAVYKAYDTEAKRDVALKVLTPELAAKPIMIERFRREARNASKLHHPNVVQVYEFGEADGCFFIAMEFVEGIDLNEYVERKGPLDPDEALRLITQATKALDHAHRRDIVHRDVKPSNFLLTRKKGRLFVKLTDLGLSRDPQAEEFRVTRDGTTVGTVDYISPEQARDSGTADIRSDLYSLGCTWHHLVAGKAPFAEGGLAERLHKHLNVDPPDPRRSTRASRGPPSWCCAASWPSARPTATRRRPSCSRTSPTSRPAAHRPAGGPWSSACSPTTKGRPPRRPPPSPPRKRGPTAAPAAPPPSRPGPPTPPGARPLSAAAGGPFSAAPRPRC